RTARPLSRSPMSGVTGLLRGPVRGPADGDRVDRRRAPRWRRPRRAGRLSSVSVGGRTRGRGPSSWVRREAVLRRRRWGLDSCHGPLRIAPIAIARRVARSRVGAPVAGKSLRWDTLRVLEQVVGVVLRLNLDKAGEVFSIVRLFPIGDRAIRKVLI